MKWNAWLRMLLVTLGAAVLFQMGFLLYFRDFYGAAEKSFFVPGLSEDFVPQGMEDWEGGFLLSGYMASTGAARLYRVEPEGQARAIDVRREDGSVLTSHAGGLAVGGGFTYLAGGGGRCYVLSTEEVLDPDRETVTVLGVFETHNRASFCTVWEGSLLIGEYAYNAKYPTAPSHHITTPARDRNTALILAFSLDGDAPLGVRETPAAAWSIPERIQGMSFSADGRAVLSASSALGASQLYLYDWGGVLDGAKGVFWAEGSPVPLYYVDSSRCMDILHLPPKAEETVFSRGKLYILFESASRRFHYGRLVGGDYVYSLSLPPKPTEA